MVRYHSNYGGYSIMKSTEGLYFVQEPFLSQNGKIHYRDSGGFPDHKGARKYIQQQCMEWMKLSGQK